MPKTFVKITGKRNDVADKIGINRDVFIAPKIDASNPEATVAKTMNAISIDLNRIHYISNDLPTQATNGVKNIQTELSQERTVDNVAYTQGDFIANALTLIPIDSKANLNALKKPSNKVTQGLYALQHEASFCYRDKDGNLCGLSIVSERNDIVEQVANSYVIKDTPVETREILYTIAHVKNVNSPVEQRIVTFYTEPGMLAPDLPAINPYMMEVDPIVQADIEKNKKQSPAEVSKVPEEKVKEELSALINNDFVSNLINTQLFEGNKISLKGLTSLEARFKSSQDLNIDNRDNKSLQYLNLSKHIENSLIYSLESKRAMVDFIQKKREEYSQDPQAYININYSRALQKDREHLLTLCKSENERLDIQRSFLLIQAENIIMLLRGTHKDKPKKFANNLESTIAQIRDNNLTELSSLKDLLKEAETLYTENIPKNPRAEKPASISSPPEPGRSMLGAVAAVLGAIVIALLVLFPQIGLIAILLGSVAGGGAIIFANTRTGTSPDNASLSILGTNSEPAHPSTKLPYFEDLDTAFKEIEQQDLNTSRSEMEKAFANLDEEQVGAEKVINTLASPSPSANNTLQQPISTEDKTAINKLDR